MMEIRVLRYFLAVSRSGTITGAAKTLHVTQPTLSRQLMDLEEALGQKLFMRSNHRITLTPEGMIFRKRAEEIMEMVDKTEAEFSAMGEIVGGDIYIGGGETDAMRHVTAVIKDLQQDYPSINYHLFSGNAEDVMERLDKGMLDFGVLIQPVDISKYDYINLPTVDTWGVVMKKESLLARKKSIVRGDLLDIPLICSRQAMRRTSGLNAYADWFGEDWDRLHIVATYNLIYNAALMVEEGIGYAITLDKLLNVTGSGNLCFRPLKPRLDSKLNLVWKKHQVFSSAAQYFLERIRDEFAEKNKVH